MNLKQAKQLRTIAKTRKGKLPDVSYTQNERGTITLGPCVRKIYKQLKRFVTGR